MNVRCAAASARSSPVCPPLPKSRRPGWIHEIKHDGFRLIARRDGDRVRLITRAGIVSNKVEAEYDDHEYFLAYGNQQSGPVAPAAPEPASKTPNARRYLFLTSSPTWHSLVYEGAASAKTMRHQQDTFVG